MQIIQPDVFSYRVVERAEGEKVFALVGQDHLQYIDADLGKRECWQRVWRAGRFLRNGDATAPVGVAMVANPNDAIWTYGAQMYEGVFPKYVPTPPVQTFAPAPAREVVRSRVASRPTIAIVAIAKDEDPYLLEWLAYHLALGVDHIFLYDNGSRVPIRSQISTLGAWGFVTVRRWKDVAGKDSQLEAYAHYLRTYRRRFEWTAAVDLDEFICLPRHETIQDFLAGFGHANGIVINWRYFGSSGQVHHEPGRLTERFTRAAPLHSAINTGVKAIYRTAEIERLIHHWSPLLTPRRVCSADGTLVPTETHTVLPIKESNFENAQINHYFVKSREEWDRKARRGYSWVEEDRGLDRFKLCDTNDVEDTSVLRLAPGMDRWVARLERPTASMPRMLERIAGAVPARWRF